MREVWHPFLSSLKFCGWKPRDSRGMRRESMFAAGCGNGRVFLQASLGATLLLRIQARVGCVHPTRATAFLGVSASRRLGVSASRRLTKLHASIRCSLNAQAHCAFTSWI